MMKKLRIAVFKLIDILVILTMVSASPMNVSATAMAQDSSPVLATDQSDYESGASARITGSGFAAGDYVLVAQGPNEALDWGTVTTDDSGVFVSNSPALNDAGSYEVRAYDVAWSGDWNEVPVASIGLMVSAPPPPTDTPTEPPTATEPPTVQPTDTQAPTDTATSEPTATEPPTSTPTTEPTSTQTSGEPPTIASDYPDYPPGALVTLTGANWQGDTEVRIIVNDDVGQSWRRDVIVLVAEDGTITDSFNLPAYFIANYSVTARGQQTDRVATTTFTDAQEDYKHYADKAPASWQNGALQSTNSQYFEGEVVPHYWKTEGLTPGSFYAFNIYYDYYDPSSGGYCGFDYMAQYNLSRTPPPVAPPTGSGIFPSANAPIVGGPGNFYTVNANIIGLIGPINFGVQRYVQVRFQAFSPKAEFYWGLHLAQPSAISGCQGAKAWPGASLQSDVRSTPVFPASPTIMLGGGGSMQINPSAVIRGSISGFKWNDQDGDGVVDGTEPKLSGWTIRLCADSACTSILQTTTTDGSGNYTFNVAPGSYYVREVLQTGWSQTFPLPGFYGPLVVNAFSPTYSNLNFGNRQANTITIIKDADPNDPQDFSFFGPFGSFMLDDDSNAGLSNSISYGNLTPGVYPFGENVPSGWALAGIQCVGDNGNTVVPPGSNQVNIILDPGENITCTFINRRQTGTITIIKDAVPNDVQDFSFGGDLGSFSLDDDSDPTLSNTQTFTNQLAGTYRVGEGPIPAGWDLISIKCTDPDNGTTISGGVAYIELDPSENITCTFTNSKRGTIIVEKQTDPDGAVGSFTFTGNAAGTISDNGQIVVSNLVPGTYTSTENDPAPSFALTNIACDDSASTTPSTVDIGTRKATFKLDPGETVKCIFTNTQQPAQLTLFKKVITDNGGTATVADFQAYIDGNPVPWGAAQILSAGSYTASESTLAGYTASGWFGDCAADGTITLTPGQKAVCTIDNNDNAPSLTLVKVVNNDNGGSTDESSWTLTAAGPTGFSGPGPSVSNGTSFDAGTYDLSESGPSGYSASSWECVGGTQNDEDTITLGLGESATCTITNDDASAHLTLVKQVITDNGGTAVATDWTLTATGPTPLSGAGGADGDVNAGTYTLSETGPSGYTASAWSCVGGSQNDDEITLLNGESATCTIINHDNAPSLELVKVVVNDNGGTAETTDFTLTATGPTSISGNGGANSDASFQAGTYDLSETSVPGYSASAWDCTGGNQIDGDTVQIALDQDVTCIITNNDDASSLTLVKQVINDNGGQAEATDFTLSADGPTSISGDGGATSDATFDAGTYDLSETIVPGYTASDWTCVGGTQDDEDTVTVGLGEEVTCTITNDDQAPSLTLVKVVTNDDGGDAVAGDWTLTATGPTGFSGLGPSVTNTTSFEAGTYDLSESGPAGYTASDWVCVGGTQNDADTVTLALGQSATCTITNNDVAPTLKLVKFVNNDNGGNASPNDWVLYAIASAPDDGRNFSNLGGSGDFEPVYANVPYDLSESVVAGYTAGTWSCSGGTLIGSTLTLEEGETGVTCTITNDDSAPTLTLVKIVVLDDGGDAVVADFSLFINGNPVTSGVSNTLSANTLYTATETNLAGYTASAWGGDCAPNGTITLSEGQNAICTITNDDVAPTLKLVKNVITDNGGNAVADDWTLSAAAAAPFDGRDFSNAGGSGVFETVFANTGYDLSETTLPGYTASNWSCNGGTLVDSTVTLIEGENVTCTITNDDVAPQLRLVKTVVNDDGGNAMVADFPLFIDGQPVTSSVFVPVTANTVHTATETTQTGYTASPWGGDCAADGTITLNEGEVKTCTITNDDVAPTLKLVKDVVNDNGGNASANDWTLSADAAAPSDGRNFSNAGGSGVFETVFANAGYDLSESTVAGYTAGSWSCDGGTLVGSTVTLNEGETEVTCTITNDDSAPTLTLIKTVINDNGGNAQPNDFNLTIGGNAATSGITYTLDANTPYAINETQLSGYTFVDITGDAECPAVLGGTVILDEGENVTCTITNDDVAPTLTLIKNVINDNGGSAQPNDFNLTIGGNAATSGTAYPLSANTAYAINETLLAGYSFVNITGDPECPSVLGGTVTLDEGENVICTITNDDQAATLIIIKHVINDNGGTADAGDFTLDSGGTDDTPDDFPGEEAPGTTVTLDAGAYNVTETGPSGYSASFSADCSGSIANGQTKTCTVTNDDIQPQLIVIKHVINDNGGTAPASAFTMEVSGNNVNPANFAGAEAPGSNVALDAGSYSVGETGPAGYAPSFSADCTGSIAVGQTKTCTITNNDISPTLTVVKVLLPGTDTGLFNLQIDGVTHAADIGNNGSTGPVAVNAGVIHTVGETDGTGTSLSDYVSTISGDCAPDGTVSLALAENKTCTITNVRRGSIVIVKNTLGGDGTFDFTSTSFGPFSLTTSGGTASTTFSGLDPANTYDVAETVPGGWELNSATCNSGETINSIDLDPGETVTCTFENEKAGSIVIIKNTVGGDGVFDFTSSTLGDFSLTTTSNAASTTFSNLDVDLTYDVAETIPAGWDLTSATCDSGETVDSIDLEPGETVTCTFTNTKRAAIVITKEAVPDDQQDFNFTATESTDTPIPDFTLDDDADNTLPKTMTFADLKPGDYTVTETLVAGWDLTGMSCASTVNLNSGVNVNINTATATINLGAGDTIVCTFRNTKRGHIIVDKVTDPSGDAQSFSFDAQGGFSPVYLDFSLTDASVPNDQELRPGIYSVTETLPAGWDLESATCTSSIGDTETPAAIELDAGETVNCTFTNEKDAFIIVEKQTDPNGDPTLFDFTTDYGPAFQLSDGQTNNSGDLDPGTYSVTETLPAGWDLESVTCSDSSDPSSISLQAGEAVTCVFTNEKDAFIIVEKQTIPDGDPQVFDFDLSYGTGDTDLSDGQTDNSGDLDPGTYSVSENVPSGWDLTSAVCSDGSSASSISLQAGETVTCVFTNTKRGHIIVDKVTLPSGDTQSFSFTTTGTGYNAFSLTDAAAPNDQELVPGTYSVTETVPANWDLTGLSCTDPSGAPVIAGNKATINLAAGETVNCTFTNTKRGTITIVKDALPNDAQDFAFTSTIPGAATFSLDDDSNNTLSNTKTVTNLVPGAYSLTEGAVTGWDLTGLTCNDANGTTNLGTRTASIALDPGENVTCTFTNTKRGTIIVEKQTNPNGAPGSFTFTGTAAGTIADNGTITVANLVPGTYTSTEADPSGILFALTSIVCNDGSSANPSTGNLATRTATFQLDPGETVRCVFTNTKDFHAGTIGFWKNWRNHYTSAQAQLLINYLKSNNPKIYNKDLILNNSDDFNIAKWDAILKVGSKTPREQMILAQFTALKLNLAITQLDGTGGLVQKNDDLCTAGIVDVSGISGAATFFGTSTPTIGQIVNAVENKWTGKLTTNRSDWKWNLTTSQKDMLIKVTTGINEGTLVMSSGCP